MDMQILFEDGRVRAVEIQAEGCPINQATASIASELMLGMSTAQVISASGRFRQAMTSKQCTG